MKRFYCTICKRVKRVRVYPASVALSTDTLPVNRQGTCSWHTSHSYQHVIRTNQPITAEYGAMRISVKSTSSKSKSAKAGK